MVEIRIETNAHAVANDLEVGASDFDATMKRALGQALEFGRGFLAKYPPPPPGSTYRRTGTLGRRWTTRMEPGPRFAGVIGNVTPYAPDVQDRERQAEIHMGRWQTIQELAEEPQISSITQIIQQAVTAWAKGVQEL